MAGVRAAAAVAEDRRLDAAWEVRARQRTCHIMEALTAQLKSPDCMYSPCDWWCRMS
jgi:hypothetical protein